MIRMRPTVPCRCSPRRWRCAVFPCSTPMRKPSACSPTTSAFACAGRTTPSAATSTRSPWTSNGRRSPPRGGRRRDGLRRPASCTAPSNIRRWSIRAWGDGDAACLSGSHRPRTFNRAAFPRRAQSPRGQYRGVRAIPRACRNVAPDSPPTNAPARGNTGRWPRPRPDHLRASDPPR